MDAQQPPWRGLWTPWGQQRRSTVVVIRLVVYLGTPLGLALLFGEVDDLRRFAGAYLGAFIVASSIGAMFELAYGAAWPRIIRRRIGLPARIAGHAITMVIAVGIGGGIAAELGRIALGWHDVMSRLWLQGLVISFAIVATLVVADEMNAQASELERREAAHRLAALRAELSALQARTDPHFLFNSLNTIAALVARDPALAETLLEQLAAVFRYALDAGRRETVELADEIDAVVAYLEIEARRLGDRLRWHLDREPGAERVRVPPLVLQPLVDNAIRHGAGGRRGTTEVAVSVHQRGGELILSVEDRGVDDAAAAPAGDGSGTALADLRARLALIYGDRARLTAGRSAPAGWRSELVLPVEPA